MRAQLHGSAGPGGPSDPSRNCVVIPERPLVLSGVALALAASSLLSVTPAGANIISGVPDTTYSGQVGSGDPSFDQTDEYDFSGLNTGDGYSLLVTDTDGGTEGALILNLYHDSTNPANRISGPIDICCSGAMHDFTGFLPSSVLILTVGLGTNEPCCEGYTLRLHTTPTINGAPEPATLALIGAGLAGALVARRRKRG